MRPKPPIPACCHCAQLATMTLRWPSRANPATNMPRRSLDRQLLRSEDVARMIRNLAVLLFASLCLSLSALGQETPPEPTTVTGETIQEGGEKILKLQLRPMTAEQIEVEANAWMAELAKKNGDVSVNRIADLKGTANATNLVQLREEQTRLVDRLKATMAALTARGGDVTKFKQYIDASTGVDLDASNITGTLKFATDWLTSKEGGIRVGLNILKFLITLLVFKILAGIAGRIARRAVGKLQKSSDLLRDFFVTMTRRIVFFLGLIIALDQLEVDISPFVAALGAAVFVIGLALQGTLSNFASGMMILLYRPFDVGEVVNAAGTTGKVEAMTLVSTTLRLPDNQTVVVPNNSIWGGVITNVTGQPTRRVDMVFGCGYGDDLQKAQKLLEAIISEHQKVLSDPAPVIKVHELADSSVNFVVRPWCKTEDYWDVFWDVTRAVKDRFDAEGINIPFPQQEVHMHQVQP